MKSYIGLKAVKAEPEQRQDIDTGLQVDGYKVVYKDGYESWSPKETFEEAYHESGNLSFSEALYAARHLVQRFLVQAGTAKSSILLLLLTLSMTTAQDITKPTIKQVIQPLLFFTAHWATK